MIPKRYIGDGVYAEIERGMIKVTTENGYETTNTIFLEVDVYQNLVKFAEDAMRAAKEARDNAG